MEPMPRTPGRLVSPARSSNLLHYCCICNTPLGHAGTMCHTCRRRQAAIRRSKIARQAELTPRRAAARARLAALPPNVTLSICADVLGQMTTRALATAGKAKLAKLDAAIDDWEAHRPPSHVRVIPLCLFDQEAES